MLRQWVVEIWDPKRKRFGTGYAVAPNRVLTAYHVAADGREPASDCAIYWLRPLGTDPKGKPEAWWLGQLLWSNADPGIDLALLEPVRPKDTPDANPIWSTTPVARLGQITGSERVACRSIGFPKFQRLKRVNDTYSLRGDIDPDTGIKEGRLIIQIARSPTPREPETWGGLSGAALFDEDRLIGVVTNVDMAFNNVVVGTPLVALRENPDFCAALRQPYPLKLVEAGTGGTIARRAPRPVRYNLPSLPPNYQERPEAVRAVKSQVLGEARAIGVHGMAGIGKTVLATALLRDQEVDAAFPDGIVWLNFGREADATHKQAELAQALTRESHSFRGWEEGRGALSQLTETDQLLVVLDDLWRIEQYDAFSRLGSDCRILVTTRDRRILDRLGGVGHELQLLSTEAALEMLAGATKSSLNDLPAEAPDVAKECGYLPLALASVGALIDYGDFTWAEILDSLRKADLDELVAILPEYNMGVLAALKLSVDVLQSEERECFLDCAVFREDVAIPETILLRFWSLRLGDPKTARSLARRLVRLTLLRREQLQTDDTRRYRLHDLYHDYLVHAAAPLPPRHEFLLHAYRRDCPDSWASFPEDDGYLLDWLPYHLIGAGRGDECRDLLFDLAWLRRKLAARNVHALIADTGLCPTDAEVERLGRALRMSAHVLGRDKRQLFAQLLGRLGQEDGIRTARLLDTAYREIPAAALVPHSGRYLLPAGPLLQTLEGHSDRVDGVVVLADGERALSWSSDLTLRLWDLGSGENRALEGHRAWVTGAVVLADGPRVLSWSRDWTLRLWDPASGASRTLEGHSDWVTGAVVLADGARALSWSRDGTLRLWDLASGESRALEGHRDRVAGAVVLADGARALSWSNDWTLRVWDLASGESRGLAGHSDRVAGAVVLADGARALSWSSDRTLRLWDLASGESRGLAGHSGWVAGAVVLADSTRALSWAGGDGSTDHTLRLWDLASGESRALDGHRDQVAGAAMLGDGARALSWSGDRTLRLWDLASEESRVLAGHSREITGAVVLADSTRALSWSGDRTLRLWNLNRLEEISCFVADDPLTCCAVSEDGRIAVVGDSRGRVMCFDLPT